MPTQREAEPDGRKPYFDVEVYVYGAEQWVRTKSYKTEHGAAKALHGGLIIPRRIVRVHPDGRREVVG